MSLPNDLADDAVEVKADGFMKIEAISAYGISLLPQDGNAGGYPLIAYVNGDERTRHVIRGPQVLRSERGELITSLKVDAREGGGLEGDTWDVTVLPHASSRLDARFRHDVDGFLAMRAAGVRKLFDINSQADSSVFTNAFGGGAVGSFMVTMDDPSTFTPSVVGAWDVSRFSNVLLVVDQLGAAGLTWSFKANIDFMHSLDGGTLSLETYGMGTDNEFGNAGVPPWPAGSVGYIHIGAGENAAATLTRKVLSTTPFLRFRFEVAANAEAWELVDWTTRALRIRAVAW